MKNRTWLITGVSSGFGYEMTKQLLEKGNKVIGTVRNKNKVADLIEKYFSKSVLHWWSREAPVLNSATVAHR
ncbi:SDR family NAD(P)-dependent oxidoreductase [Paenibacillus polymyxa]|uniref:SDR family NAD(P)-dependent oxidoreductase n=1 Tax=Paenibacillus polymyxa TaxID=1406 RepID=UPI00234A131B|nr:SDR family NAD(P)-dependent oxidoreductase [Paenibacillus polymyxa]WCM63792.1 SDR family NAD(P)-dependent oxidoreductase [Paenibacillus polymyxa]